MLYKLIDDMSALQPQPFGDFSRYDRVEKELEKLLATQFALLFEDAPLLPFHQSRSFQGEGDVYCLDAAGDIVVFELKRSTADSDAVEQALRYAEKCSQWTYADIDGMFRRYPEQTYGDVGIDKVHKDQFDLSEPLKAEQFNRRCRR